MSEMPNEGSTELIQYETESEPCKFLVLNDDDEGKVFSRDNEGRLRVAAAYDVLWEDYDFGNHDTGFLVWEGARVFRPDAWDKMSEDERQECADDACAPFHAYDECFVGDWRRATADDLREVGLIV